MSWRGCTCCPDRFTKSDLDKWTSRLSDLMASEEGRRRFVTFLEDRDLADSLKTVIFLETCEGLLLRIRERRKYDRRELGRVVEAAEEVDLYEGELEEIRGLLSAEADERQVTGILRRAKARAIALLEDEHKEFSKWLLRLYQQQANCK